MPLGAPLGRGLLIGSSARALVRRAASARVRAHLVRKGDEGESRRGVMAQMDDVLAELRHRIMRPFESGPPKPAKPQHQETNEEGATTQSFNAEYQRHGSAAVALRRLAHPGRDGGVVVEDDPV